MLCSVVTGEGDGTPLQYPCLENPMDGGAWWAAVHGVARSWTRLSDFTLTFHFPALEKEMATHSSVLAWRIPGTGEPGGLPSMGSHRVGQAGAAAQRAGQPAPGAAARGTGVGEFDRRRDDRARVARVARADAAGQRRARDRRADGADDEVRASADRPPRCDRARARARGCLHRPRVAAHGVVADPPHGAGA